MKRLLLIFSIIITAWSCRAQAEISSRSDYPTSTWVSTDYFTVYRSNTNAWLLPFSRFDDRFQPLNTGLTFLGGLGFTNESSFKSGINLEIGVDVQAYDADLTTLGNGGSLARDFLGLGASGSPNFTTVYTSGNMISDGTITASNHVATKAYVDAQVSGGGGADGNQYQIQVSDGAGGFSASTVEIDAANDMTNVSSIQANDFLVGVAGTMDVSGVDIRFTVPSGDIDVNSTVIKNVTDPSNAQDAATKNYADGLVDDLSGVSNGSAARNNLDLGITDDVTFGNVTTNDVTADKYGSASTSAIISGGVISASRTLLSVGTQSAAASDDLDTINSGIDSQILYLKTISNSREVTVKDGTGNIYLNGDFVLDNVEDVLTLIYFQDVNRWQEVSRSDNGS